jgi:type II secretory pathway pseudopilin PulG
VQTRLRQRLERAFTIVEVAVALGLFAIIAFVISFSLTMGVQGSNEAWRTHVALTVLRDFVAELQTRANSTDPALGIASVYQYCQNGAAVHPSGLGNAFEITGTELRGPLNGNPQVVVECFKNETANSSGNPASSAYSTYSAVIPSELGGPKDLNMDGDDDDELLPFDLKLVPMIITMTWHEQGPEGVLVRTQSIYVLLTRTAG